MPSATGRVTRRYGTKAEWKKRDAAYRKREKRRRYVNAIRRLFRVMANG